MEYFKVMYDSRVVIYEHKMLIRLTTGCHYGTLGRAVTSDDRDMWFEPRIFNYCYILYSQKYTNVGLSKTLNS